MNNENDDYDDWQAEQRADWIAENHDRILRARRITVLPS